MADGGMSYQSMGSSNGGEQVGDEKIETFLHGGATPGITNHNPTSSRQLHTSWLDGRKLNYENEDDPKWKASLILHELNRVQSSASAQCHSCDMNQKNCYLSSKC